MPIDLRELIDALRNRPIVERIEAARGLSQAGADAASAALPLLEAAGDDDEELRQWASAALEELGPPQLADRDSLARRLSDANSDRAYWAATLLGRLESDAAPVLAQLETAARESPHLVVRQQAVWAIGRMGAAAARAEETLRAAAKSPDRRLSRLASEALADLETKKPPPNQR